MTSPAHPRVRCRQIGEPDLEGVAALLVEGFPERGAAYWRAGLARMGALPQVEGCPQYGYVLESDGAPVGVLLQLYHAGSAGDAAQVRCNLSSWYVRTDFRGYAPMLVKMATRLAHVTYFNTSPAEHTLPILQAQGFGLYSQGQMLTLPAFVAGRGRVEEIAAGGGFDGPDSALVEAQAAHGCISLVCETDRGPEPFVFVRRRIGRLPVDVAQLVYCRSTADFVRCAGSLGRELFRRGMVGVICDSDPVLARLPGKRFAEKGRRYFKGPSAPRINDLSFTETVVFGP